MGKGTTGSADKKPNSKSTTNYPDCESILTGIRHQLKQNWIVPKHDLFTHNMTKHQTMYTPNNEELLSELRQNLDRIKNNIMDEERPADIVARNDRQHETYVLSIKCNVFNLECDDGLFFKQVDGEHHTKFLHWTNEAKDYGDQPILFHTSIKDGMPETCVWMSGLGLQSKYLVCDSISSKDNKGGCDVVNKIGMSSKCAIKEAYVQLINGILDKRLCASSSISPHFFIPIVVTNAKLHVCDPIEHNYKTNSVQSSSKYENVDCVIYECPIPETVDIPNTARKSMKRQEFHIPDKFYVLILNPKGIQEFIQKIDHKPSVW